MNTKYAELLEKFFKTEIIEDYSLTKIQKACEYFGNPQNSYKSIHIAGTNGKGSVSKMIFQILKESGKKVWVYTSPHNIDIRERFETENWLISERDFMTYASRIIEYDRWLSYYERCTLLAFLYFRDIGCDVIIMEVGMWGRLDATNILTPILSIITSISYDHMEFLGDTLEKIAWEKWGIIKPWIPVILYGENTTLEIIANKKQSPILFPTKRDITTNLIWEHQLSNARIAYEAGVFCWIEEPIITQALTHVDHPGRLQYLRSNLLIDGAHNEDGMKQLRKYLEWESPKWENIAYSFNLKKWKSASLVLNIFNDISSWNIIESEWFQVNDSKIISSQIQESGKKSSVVTPSDIFSQADNNSTTLFVVFGSLYMLREFLEK